MKGVRAEGKREERKTGEGEKEDSKAIRQMERERRVIVMVAKRTYQLSNLSN
jgi:hypothetical protein